MLIRQEKASVVHINGVSMLNELKLEDMWGLSPEGQRKLSLITRYSYLAGVREASVKRGSTGFDCFRTRVDWGLVFVSFPRFFVQEADMVTCSPNLQVLRNFLQ